MLRGVNRCIVEVAGNGSRYFEKAILFVKPEYAAMSSAKLQNDAKRYLDRLDGSAELPSPEFSMPPIKRRGKRRIIKRRIVLAVLAAAFIIGYTIFIRSL